jgi:hypothetical protein
MTATLPFASEFSPFTMALADVLDLAAEHAGNLQALDAALKAKYFDSTAASEPNKTTRAYNLRLGMQTYLLLDKQGTLTNFGVDLHSKRGDLTLLHEAFARHILLNLHGVTLVQCVLDMLISGAAFNLVTLREWMVERGVGFPSGGTHASKMKLWLEKAGIFSGWRVNEVRFRDVLGTPVEEVEALASLSREQKAYLRALANIGTPGPHRSNDIQRLAGATHGIKFNEKNLPQQVLYKLRDAGFITLERGTKAEGRGAKPFLVAATDKLRADVLEPLLAQLDAQINAELRPLLRRPLSDILPALRSSDRHIKGLALEALAFKLMRLLDLNFVAYRKRGQETGGAEVDLIFDAARLVYSRWQIQCKNTGSVDLEDVAKEVGLTHFLKSTVIAMVSTGTIGADARRYAARIMRDTNLCILMIDGSDLASIEANPAAMVDVANREAHYAMRLKPLEE